MIDRAEELLAQRESITDELNQIGAIWYEKWANRNNLEKARGVDLCWISEDFVTLVTFHMGWEQEVEIPVKFLVDPAGWEEEQKASAEQKAQADAEKLKQRRYSQYLTLKEEFEPE